MSRATHLGILGFAIASLLATAASAQTGRISRWPVDGAPQCVPLTSCRGDADCNVARGEACVRAGCEHPDDLVCSLSGSSDDCPSGTYMPPGYSFCVSKGQDPCGSEWSRECFLPPGGGTRLVRWGLGDCDLDHIPNELEAQDANEVCTPERAIGVIHPDGTCAEANYCERRDQPEVCLDTHQCEPPAPDVGGRCLPREEPAFCCKEDGELSCDDLGHVCNVPPGEAFAFCTPQTYCPDYSLEMGVSCFQYEGEFVRLDQGDCDNDGRRNDDEANSSDGFDPCINEDAPDGGGPDYDGGPDGDAGDDRDRLDGSTNPGGPTPMFGGGGGCACRASLARPSTPGLLVLLPLLALTLRRRRR